MVLWRCLSVLGVALVSVNCASEAVTFSAENRTRAVAIQDELEAAPEPGEGSSAKGGGAAAEPVGKAVPESLTLDVTKVLYLTFDDGPDEAATPMILDVLAKHTVKGTFFHTGNRLEETSAIVQREAAEGHIVASHQMDHETPDDDRGFVRQVEMERDLIDRLVPGQPRYFRYPFGAGSLARDELLKKSGYFDGGVGWDIDSFDWCFGEGGRGVCAHDLVPAAYREDFIGWVLHQVDMKKGGVVLFHDIQALTAKNLDAILVRLKKAGYRFANLPSKR